MGIQKMSVNQVGADQNDLRIKLQTNIDFSGTAPTIVEIYYWNPTDSAALDELENSNKSGIWTATILAGSETDGVIYYDLLLSQPMEQGTWTVRAVLTYADGRQVYCQMVNMVVSH